MASYAYAKWIAAIAALAAVPVAAQTAAPEAMADPDAHGEIIVTGSRLREESVQATPITVSVVNADRIESLHANNISAISSVVPNLQLNETSTSPGVPSVSLRGFSTRSSDISTEPGVALYIDGVYQTIITGSLSDLFDLDRLEVLRGPQGTLLGKNAAAGAILLTRSRPTGEWGGRASFEYGSHNLMQAQGLVNAPIVPGVLAGKLYASYRYRDGWVRNLAMPGQRMNGEEKGTVRGALLFTPADNFELYLTGDYIWDRSEQQGLRNISDATTLGCQIYDVCHLHDGLRGVTSATYVRNPTADENNLTANAKWEMGGVNLTSITGYRQFEQENHSDLDGSPAPILETHLQDFDVEQISQEVRLTSADGGGLDMGGRLSWLIAGYYGHSKASMDQTVLAFGSPTSQSQESVRDSYAVFGHLDFDITDAWTVSFGARRSWDKVKHRFSLPALDSAIIPPLAYEEQAKFSNTSFEAGTQYQIDPDKMIFFRYAEGYRGGGFVGLPGSLDSATSFRPESSTSYEIGAKTDWLNGALRVNITLFDVKFDDMQRDITRAGAGNTYLQVTANAASATTRGVEIETIVRPVNGLVIAGNFGYLDAKYNRYTSIDPATGNEVDLSDIRLFYSPKYTANATLDYTIGLGAGFGGLDTLGVHGSFDWRSNFEMSTLGHPVGHQPAYGVANAALNFSGTDSPLTLSFYVQNMFDKRYSTIANDIGNLIYFASDNIGRTFGVIAGVKF